MLAVLLAMSGLGAVGGNPDEAGGPAPFAAIEVGWSWFSPSSWFDGKSHRGTGRIYVRVDRSKLGKGVLFLDDVDLKSSPTGIIVRPPGMSALRNAVPGMFHDWNPTEYCRIVVHPNEITVVDVQFNGKLERSADGTFVSGPSCKCLIQALRDKSTDGREIPTCE
jgi:hypothetical protein